MDDLATLEATRGWFHIRRSQDRFHEIDKRTAQIPLQPVTLKLSC